MKTHREMYPEQYTHPLCGKVVRLKNNHEHTFTVKRVVNSRFGQMAVPADWDGRTVWAVRDLEECS